MANQVTVSNDHSISVTIEPPANVQVQVSRAVIGTVANVASANLANYVIQNSQPNITSVGTLVGLTSNGNITAPFFIGNVVGNISGNFAVPGINTAVLFNQTGNAGASDALTFNYVSNVLTANGNIIANYYIGDGSQLTGIVTAQSNNANFANVANIANSVAGANVSGVVANANYSAYSGIAGVANSVAVANVSGIGNIATVNLDGNASNILFGNGTFSAIPVISNVANANYANFAGEAFSVSGANVTSQVANANYAIYSGTVITNAQPNITSVGTLTGLVVSGNITPNANITYDLGNNTNRFKDLYLAGNSIILGAQTISANATGIAFTGNLSGDASALANITGANVTGTVANANYSVYSGTASTANSVAGANVSGIVANANYSAYSGIAGSANSVAVANVSGIGNIATVNLDGNASNILFGNGTFSTVPNVSNVANANYANFAGQVVDATQSNITTVGTLTTLTVSGNAIITGNLVVNGNTTSVNSNTIYIEDPVIEIGGGANGDPLTINDGRDRGTVLDYYDTAPISAFMGWKNANGRFEFASNVTLANNVVTVNQLGNVSASYYIGNGSQLTGITATTGNANYANFAGEAFSVSAANIVGTVNLANFATTANSVAGANVSGAVAYATTANAVAGANVSGEVAFATTANSVAVANVSGIGNIATVNLDGNVSNLLTGSGTFVAIPTVSSNANYANFAGQVVDATQSNITAVGNLPYLQVSNSANADGVIQQFASNNITFATNFSSPGTYKLTTQYWPNASTSYPAERVIRSRGNVTTPTTAVSGDRITNKSYHVFNGNTNPLAVSETYTTTGTVNANTTAQWTGGQFNWTTGNPGGDTANQGNSSWQNQLIFTNSGSLQINPGGPANISLGQSSQPLIITNYGSSTTDLVNAGGMNQQRARGNRDALLSVEPNDNLGRWNSWGYNGSAYVTSNVASITMYVDGSYLANSAIIPMNISFTSRSNTGTSSVRQFYGNGLSTFPGDIVTSSNANVGALNVTGLSSLGNVGNVRITGGTANYVLKTDGTGNLDWVAQSGGGGTPGGSNTELQFNNNGTFGGISTVTYNGSNISLGAVANVKVTGGSNNEVMRTDGVGNLSFTSIAQTLLVGTRAGPYTVPITNYTFQVTTRSSGNVTVYVN